ncbi:hypothetical protein [Nocardioides sp.]|uniref:hypothetical protein n=1 Tax=Nocardioides sp. TaxID=35761 RepID=UPI002ED24F29
MKFVLLVALIAVAIYFTIRVIERRGVRRPPRPTRPPQRPIGPDDDPDFLSGLN